MPTLPSMAASRALLACAIALGVLLAACRLADHIVADHACPATLPCKAPTWLDSTEDLASEPSHA